MPRRPILSALVFSAMLVYSGVASATVWHDGDLITYSQGVWGTDPAPGNAAALLVANYASLYAATSGLMEVGIPGPAGFSLRFTNADSLIGYLPASGGSGPLDSDLLDPDSSSAGGFGGRVTALRLNIDFSEAGLLNGTSGLRFGDLVLANFGFRGKSPLNGLTVRQFQGVVNTLLGGGTSIDTIADVDLVLDDLNIAFGSGYVSAFAQDHLLAPALPVPVFPYSNSLPRGYEEQAPVVAR